jgi:hypothetical protein
VLAVVAAVVVEPRRVAVRDERVDERPPRVEREASLYERSSGWSSKASDGVERHRGVSGLKAKGGWRDTPGSKVLKDRRSPRRRGRMGTSVR